MHLLSGCCPQYGNCTMPIARFCKSDEDLWATTCVYKVRVKTKTRKSTWWFPAVSRCAMSEFGPYRPILRCNRMSGVGGIATFSAQLINAKLAAVGESDCLIPLIACATQCALSGHSLSCGYSSAVRIGLMAPSIYRCPATGMKVQGWFADDPSSANGNEVYEAVVCTACTRVHLVNPKTGKTIGGDTE